MPSLFDNPVYTQGSTYSGSNTQTNSIFDKPISYSNSNQAPSPKPTNTVTQTKPQPSLLQNAENIGGGLLNKAGNFIDNLFPGTIKPALVVSPIPNQNTKPVTPSKVQNVAQAVKQVAPQTVQTVEQLIKDPKNLKSNPQKAVGDAMNSIKDALTQEKDRISSLFSNTPKTTPQKIGGVIKIATGAANVAFSPLTALFTGANDIPVLGTVSKLLTLPFTVLGEAGSNVSNMVVDHLPISPQAKDAIKPALAEVGALAAQIIGGKLVLPEVKNALEQKFGPEDTKTIITKAQEVAKEAQLKAPETAPKMFTPEELRNKVIGSDLENTPAGKELLKTASDAETQGRQVTLTKAQEGELGVLSTKSGTSFKIGVSTDEVAKNFTPLTTEQPKVVPKQVSVPKEQLPVGTGAEKVSKLEARMKNTLDNVSEEKIKELGLSTYNQMNKKEQIAQASDYVSNNPEEALKVLKGQIDPPKGLIPESIYIAMTNAAKDDVTLATKLSSLQATALGQRISILSELDPNNPVKLMNDVVKVRESSALKRTGGKTIKQATGDILKQVKQQVKAPDKHDWGHFLDSIQC